jgi:RNA polymerase sigma-70 factor (ECF subfamily)
MAMEDNNMSTITEFPARAEEDRLIQRTLDGDKDAFTPLILKYKDSLFDLAYRILRNRADAEDVLQIAFLEAYKHLREFNHQSRFSTWVYSIVLNRVRNHLRHHQVIRWTSLDAPRLDHEDSRTLEIPEKGSSLHKALEHKLQLENVEREVKFLPVLHRSIFVLHYFQAMPLAEVARRLNRPLGTVKVYLHRARKLLYRRLTLPPVRKDNGGRTPRSVYSTQNAVTFHLPAVSNR